MTLGKFITIEGSEGAGKSTAMNYMRSHLADLPQGVIFTREPGGTGLAEEIRKVLLYPASNEKMTPETELLLMFAGRAQHLNVSILPALQAGKWVVSDRFIDASYAYQGGGRGIPIETIQTLDKLIVGRHYPDLTLLLDVPAELGFSRTEKRSSPLIVSNKRNSIFVRVRKRIKAEIKIKAPR